jgi:hypothetical protein
MKNNTHHTSQTRNSSNNEIRKKTTRNDLVSKHHKRIQIANLRNQSQTRQKKLLYSKTKRNQTWKDFMLTNWVANLLKLSLINRLKMMSKMMPKISAKMMLKKWVIN